jgi:hypothetical protein
MDKKNAGAFYLGLGLMTGATLALEITQTRMLSVVSWYHLAFFVISVAMFGMTLGSLLVFLRPGRFPEGDVGELLARYSILAAFSVGIAFIDQICLVPEMVFSAATVVVFARLALTVSVPFFFSGVVVTLALTRSPYPVGLTYGSDLVGAALGCLAVIPILTFLSGPGAEFATGAIMAMGAFAFSRWAKSGRLTKWSAASFAVLAALAAVHAFTLHGLTPLFVKGQLDKRTALAYERWNSFSRVTALKPREVKPAEVMWAASDRMPKTQIDAVLMNIDGLAGTVIYKMEGDPKRIDFLRYDATAMAYAVRKGRAAIIGVGGGKDVMTALVTGHADVLGVELNPAMTRTLTGPFRQFAGLADNSGVRLVTDEARSWFTRSKEKFDIIQASLIDTWAATGAGAFSLSENSIYTIEAWRVFLSRLTPGGIFTVSRWHAPDLLDETARLLSLACAALYDAGAADPASQILLGSHGHIATILVSNAPFTKTDVEAWEKYCAEMDFTPILAPGRPPPSETLRRIVDAKSISELFRIGRSTPLDLTPPTDSRPFFFNLVRMSRPWEVKQYLGRRSGVVTGNMIATLTLLTILFVTFLLGVATLVAPRYLAPPEMVRPRASALAYFALIGFGFMFTEIAFMQRLSVYLGHPVYSLAVVLFSLIFFTGLGSFASEKLGLTTFRRFAAFLFVLVGYLVAAALALPKLTVAYQAASLAGRVLLSIAVLAPAGVMMGQAFPAGMRMARGKPEAADSRDPTPWLWGVNGAAGVFASGLAVAVSIAYGIDTTMYLAAACYAAILFTLPGLLQESR